MDHRHRAWQKPNTVPSIFYKLAFQIEPADGGASYWADLEGFASGQFGPPSRPGKGGGRWGGDTQGRRGFALALAGVLCDERPPEPSFLACVNVMRTFFQFLDSVDPDGEIDGPGTLSDLHGIGLRRWLGRQSLDGRFEAISGLVSKLRRARQLPPLLWHTGGYGRRSRKERMSPEIRAVAALFSAMRKEAMQVKAMFHDGERLAGHGPSNFVCFDPDSLSEEDLQSVRNALSLCRDGGVLDSSLRWHGAPSAPDYRPPGMGVSPSRDVGGTLRWVVPGYHDTASFLWMFLLKTGWNLGTALSIDLSTPDYVVADPAKPDHVTIQAFKARASAFQTITSKTAPDYHPHRILQYMVERTEPLRAILRRRLAAAEAVPTGQRTLASDRELSRLRVVLKSPWLYHSWEFGRVEVHAFEHQDCSGLNQLARRVAKRHGLLEKHEALGRMVTSSARLSWIGQAYERSGFDVIVAKLAAGHQNLSTTQGYIKTRHLREAGRDRFRLVQDAVFREVSIEKPLDVTRLRQLVDKGEITKEQEQRLLDLRARTKVGMGCKDSQNPPRKVAPRHRAGTTCAVQRCTGCSHGVVFDESLPLLARRLVELRLIHAKFPQMSWSGSSFEAEEKSMQATLARFDAGRVLEALNDWDAKFEAGEAHVAEIAGWDGAFVDA